MCQKGCSPVPKKKYFYEIHHTPSFHGKGFLKFEHSFKLGPFFQELRTVSRGSGRVL